MRVVRLEDALTIVERHINNAPDWWLKHLSFQVPELLPCRCGRMPELKHYDDDRYAYFCVNNHHGYMTDLYKSIDGAAEAWNILMTHKGVKPLELLP